MPRRNKEVRTYDASGRLEQARRSREAVIDVARAAFITHGYAATTVATIAAGAGVSVETIYKTFGGKTGLVRAIWERGLAGRGLIPAPERSDAMSAVEGDPRALVRKWGELTAEVSPILSPIVLLVREAAATDPELAEILREIDAQRLARMRQNAGVLHKRGFLRRMVSVEEATDVMWAYTSAEIYEAFVLKRGWTAKRLGDFVGSALEAALLD